MTFIKLICLAAFLFSAFMASSEIHQPKIVIIGAGLAGLTTAYRLHTNGADVHVYEARDRVGGRVLSAQVGGNIAELGGQNITDGGEAKNIFGLIRELGLELIEDRVRLDHSYYSGDSIISMQQALSERQFDPEALKIRLKELAETSSNMQEVLRGIVSEDDPLYTILKTKLAAFEGGPIEDLSCCYVDTLYHMLQGGVSAAHTSHEHPDHSLNFVSLKEGNDHLAMGLAEALEGRVHLKKVLKRVSKKEDGPYVLAFNDGLKVNADILVLALPCSVYADIEFEGNALPPQKLKAIRSVKYGSNAKIIVPFAQHPKGKTPIISGHMGSFYNRQRHLLTVYYVGEASRFTDDTIGLIYSQDRPLIETGFGKLDQGMPDPVCAADRSGGIYEGPVGFSWPNDPFVKGTYSYIAKGQEDVLTATCEEDGERFKSLFAPINHSLYFAGEHASILQEAPGTMEAACESGERVARVILKMR